MEKSAFRVLPRYRLALLLTLLIVPSLLTAQQTSLDPTYAISDDRTENLLAKATFTPEGFDATTTARFRDSYVSPTSTATFTAELVRPVHSSGIAPAILVVALPPHEKSTSHPFWDRKNRLLLAMNGAMAGADFFTTHRNLKQHNGKELNPVVGMFAGSTPALATNFALETGGVVAISYIFHRTGHHKLERLTSYVNLGASAFAVGYNLSHH